ncbi:MAG: sugar transferase [Solirubrobacterales bacterium]
MDLTTDNSKRRLPRRRRKTGKPGEREGSVPPPLGSALTEALNAGRGKPGAPLARSPLQIPRPSAPIDLSGGVGKEEPALELEYMEVPEGRPGGRRSRAHGTAEEQAQIRPLRVVSGGGFELESDAETTSRSLSPSNAAALGDFAAAMAGPLAGAIYLRSIAVFIGSALLVMLLRAQARRSALSEGEISGLSPVVAAAGVFVLSLAVHWSSGFEEAATAAAAALAAGAIAALFLKIVTDRFVHVRIAVVGEAATAHQLAWQLARERVGRYTIVGYVTRTSERDNLRDLDHVSFKVRRLGLLSDLSHIVARNDIELLVMAADQDRMKVFERATVCAERYRTRLIALTAFEEAVFRRVPVDQLNVAWFQAIMHPRFRPAPRFATRMIDLTVALVAGLLTAPFWLLSAAFIKLAFGGPVLVRRRRVGERGRSFSVLRFRVAANDEDGNAPAEDVPAAGFGRVLRRTHIEALPQLLNVLRGDMSLVGPEPATPKLVAEVENEIEFYGRRHLVRPGLTGWAQLHRLPDEEEDVETMLSRDLFYLKHQSLLLYVYVLLSAVWSAFTGNSRARAQA